MNAAKLTWTRNTDGLHASAKQRAESTRRRVDDAIAALLRDPFVRINFNTVAAAAGVTKAYLYKEPELRGRIDVLRQQQDEAKRNLAPLRQRTEASTRLLVAAKDRRIWDLEARQATRGRACCLPRATLRAPLTGSGPWGPAPCWRRAHVGNLALNWSRRMPDRSTCSHYWSLRQRWLLG